MDPFEYGMAEFIGRERLIERGDVVLAAVSGGPDSTALALALGEAAPALGVELCLAHYNHGARGEESDRDQAWVEEFAVREGLRLVTGRAAPGSFSGPGCFAAPANGGGHCAGNRSGDRGRGNFEERMREARYNFLREAARETGAGKVALGHHLGDVAETTLMNILRGAGGRGAGSLRALREAGPPGCGHVSLIRPLLWAKREEVIAYLGRRGQGYCRDSSNSDTAILRNRVRSEVMPLLRSINPEAERALARHGRVAAMETEALRALAEELLDHSAEEVGGGLALGLAGFAAMHPGFRRAILRAFVERVRGDLRSIYMAHVEDLDRLAAGERGGGSLDLPGLRAERVYGRLIVRRVGGAAREDPLAGDDAVGDDAPGDVPADVILPVPGTVEWAGPRGKAYVISARLAGPDEDTGNMAGASFARAAIWASADSEAALVRSRRPGDRYRPRGLEGSKKLKDLFNELRVPPALRGRWPLIVVDEEIAWVPGARPARLLDCGGERHALIFEIEPALSAELY